MLADVNTEKIKPEGITYVKLSPRILENPGILPHILTKLEHEIFQIVSEGPPDTVKEIRDEYVRNRVPFQTGNDDIDNKFKKAYADLIDKLRARKITNSEFIKSVEFSLKKLKGFEIPSYERLDRILQSLEKLGLVTRRYDPLKKGKGLWVVNPEYLIAANKK